MHPHALCCCHQAFFGRADIERLPAAFRPDKFDAVVFKGGMGCLPGMAEFAPAGATVVSMLANTPGAANEAIPPRRHIPPGMYPEDLSRVWDAPLGERLGPGGASPAAAPP